jgi:hypothetical protein
MVRILLALLACCSLAGCWMSDERIFRNGDWAHLDLNGDYTSYGANGDVEGQVVLRTRANGLIESTTTDLDDGKIEHSVLGFVPIEGGSGSYFLTVDRKDGTAEGDLYFITHLTEGGALELYWPDCGGTPHMDGLEIARDSMVDEVCNFSSRAALMRAGLEAERFLSAQHIVTVSPLGRIAPTDDDDLEAE